MSESRKRGLLRLRLLQERTEAVEADMVDERVRFQRLARQSSTPRAVSAFNLFQTPAELADRIAGMFTGFSRVLEPSAGLGRIYNAIRKRTDRHVTLVEQSAECAGELYRITERDGNCQLIQGDFLSQDPEKLGTFDAIAMNPPFKMGTDCKHILHAVSFLSEGGRLVSICANGPRQLAQLQPIASQWIELPERSFASEGTNVSTAIVVIDN